MTPSLSPPSLSPLSASGEIIIEDSVEDIHLNRNYTCPFLYHPGLSSHVTTYNSIWNSFEATFELYKQKLQCFVRAIQMSCPAQLFRVISFPQMQMADTQLSICSGSQLNQTYAQLYIIYYVSCLQMLDPKDHSIYT